MKYFLEWHLCNMKTYSVDVYVKQIKENIIIEPDIAAFYYQTQASKNYMR